MNVVYTPFSASPILRVARLPLAPPPSSCCALQKTAEWPSSPPMPTVHSSHKRPTDPMAPNFTKGAATTRGGTLTLGPGAGRSRSALMSSPPPPAPARPLPPASPPLLPPALPPPSIKPAPPPVSAATAAIKRLCWSRSSCCASVC